LRKASVKAAFPARRMLYSHKYSAAPLASQPESLSNTQQNKQNRRPNTNLIISRETTYQKGRDPHSQKRNDQHGFPPDAIAEVTADNTANRAGRKSYSESAQCGYLSCHIIDCRKEEPVEDQNGGRSVEEEVIPLDGSTN